MASDGTVTLDTNTRSGLDCENFTIDYSDVDITKNSWSVRMGYYKQTNGEEEWVEYNEQMK